MIRTIIIPLSYAIGLIISQFTKEEIVIRKKWLNYWPYSFLLLPLALIFSTNLCILAISAINYIKASSDYLGKKSRLKVLADNLIFLLLGLVVVYL